MGIEVVHLWEDEARTETVCGAKWRGPSGAMRLLLCPICHAMCNEAHRGILFLGPSQGAHLTILGSGGGGAV